MRDPRTRLRGPIPTMRKNPTFERISYKFQPLLIWMIRLYQLTIVACILSGPKTITSLQAQRKSPLKKMTCIYKTINT